MATREKEYRRLPGKGFRRQGGWIAATRTLSTLWLGKDHLLCIDSMGGYTEDYKRFYYGDIQAIVTRRTDSWRNWNLFWGFCSALIAFVALMSSSGVVLGIWLGLAALLCIGFLINLSGGPTCVCHIRTAVQTEQLPSLKRLRSARKAIARLKPLIEEAQGAIPPEELPSRLRALATSWSESRAAAAAAAATPRPSPASQSRVRSTYDGVAHLVLFGLLVLDAAHTGLGFFVRGVGMAAVSILLWAGIAFSLVFSLIKQHGVLSAGLRRLTWGVFAYVLIVFAIGYVQAILISVQNTGSNRVMTQWDMIRIHAETSPFDSMWLLCTMIFCLLCSTSLGATGLLMVRQHRQSVAPGLSARGSPGSDLASGKVRN